ncbi:MAG: hypothetical protein AB8B55_15325 [Mariniblastus sp.]
MNYAYTDRQELQKPGAGLPWFERIALNAAVKTGAAVMTDKYVLRWINRDAAELLRLADCEDESYDVTDPIITPRVIGIEDSSRNWSVLMVLEHLCLVNTEMIKLIQALSNGIVPRGEIDVALYKPEEDIDYEVLTRFQKLDAEYTNVVGELIKHHGSLQLPARCKHPWFGLLNAHHWHCLAAFHQRVHLRQMQKIIAMLGVA